MAELSYFRLGWRKAKEKNQKEKESNLGDIYIRVTITRNLPRWTGTFCVVHHLVPISIAFSSTPSDVGLAGQARHGAANMCTASLIRQRRLGGPNASYMDISNPPS